ncbi:hypothetical protein CERSUDRAFT_120240 [Gelatoporia subvermispora B]|uniref:NACHT domain-containing protein n=1 Tax=Ceriporiopsis subvermispora (strain B) TaxID=914234 RepID=M2QWU7_CERS8|nr:hypothetical protein CERSUDRAFT_120240 [Gelatoporia subvermispora B]
MHSPQLLQRAGKRKQSPSEIASDSPPSKKPSRKIFTDSKGENIDVIVSNIQEAIDVTMACTKNIPVVSQILPPLKAVVDRIAKARANARDKQYVLDDIDSLVKCIQSISKSVHSIPTDPQGSTSAPALDATKHADSLTSDVSDIIRDLETLKVSVEETPSRGGIKRAVCADQDAEFMKRVRKKISRAREDLQIQDLHVLRAIQMIALDQAHAQTASLQSMKQLQHSIEHEKRMYNASQRLKDDYDVLEKLQPVNASYKSYLTEGKARLQPGTRAQILRDLVEWVQSNQPIHRVYVLHGTVGVGKSSIAHALCRQLAGTNLGASFFFIRGSISNVHTLFPTMAFQIADSVPELFSPIVHATRAHLRGGQCQTLKHQISGLLETPFQTIAAAYSKPTLLVVDGADECMNSPDGVVPEMLQVLCRAASNIPFLRILIATRPEVYIMNALRYSDQSGIIRFRDLGKEPNIDDDIRLFIRTEFEIYAAQGGFCLVVERPDAVELLTRLSNGLFIFATTAVRHLVKNRYTAVAAFDSILMSQPSSSSRRLLAGLDALYREILKCSFIDVASDAEHMASIGAVLRWIALWVYNAPFSVRDLELVKISTDITMDTVDRLRSVLIVDNDITTASQIRACHASFPQFLLDSARCTDPAFLVDPPSGHAMIATSLLDLLARDDADSLCGANVHMQKMWEYAGSCWDVHLCDAQYTPELGRALWGFVKSHLKDWLQKKGAWSFGSINVVRLVDYCAKAHSWCKQNGPDDELVAALDTIIDRRVKEIVVEAAQSPYKYFGDPDRIKVWAKRGYMPIEED